MDRHPEAGLSWGGGSIFSGQNVRVAGFGRGPGFFFFKTPGGPYYLPPTPLATLLRGSMLERKKEGRGLLNPILHRAPGH